MNKKQLVVASGLLLLSSLPGTRQWVSFDGELGYWREPDPYWDISWRHDGTKLLLLTIPPILIAIPLFFTLKTKK